MLNIVHRLITDDLVMLAVGAELSGWPLDASGQPIPPSGFDHVVAGGLLADLYTAGLITVHHDEVRGTTGPSASDADLSELHHQIQSKWSTRTVDRWLRDIAAGHPTRRRVDLLRRRRVLAEYDQPAEAGGGRRVFLPDQPGHDLALDDPNRALRGGSADDRTLLLLTVLRAAGLHHVWFRGLPAAKVDRRLDTLLADSWLWPPICEATTTAADDR